MRDVTIIIPLRIDSTERNENAHSVLEVLHDSFDINLFVLEADSNQKFNPPSYIDYIFVRDDNPIFHRTRYLNIMLEKTITPIIGIWDSDAVVPDIQLVKAVNCIRHHNITMCIPYDGRSYNVTPDFSFLYNRYHKKAGVIDENKDRFTLHGHLSLGGAFVVNKEKYLQIGGENEYFYGWNIEDWERVKRCEIAGCNVCRINGPLYHLYHPRLHNSTFVDKKEQLKGVKEYLKICSMNKEELMNYINGWKWNKKVQKIR